MDPILFEIVAWIAGLAAIGSAVGVLVVLAGWWIVARLARSACEWLGHEGDDQ